MACSQNMWDQLKDFSLGHLNGPDLDRVLAHIEECSSCSDDVELLARMTTLAAERGETLLEMKVEIDRGRSRYALLAGLLGRMKRFLSPIPFPARVLVPVGAAVILFFAYGTLSHRSGGYGSLADLTPAPYYQASLRGSAPEGEALFTKAMGDYLEGDYEGASGTLLRLAHGRDCDEKVVFYLGVSLLLAGETDDAVLHLERTAGSSNAAMRQASVWYLTQADLLEGNLEAARTRLELLSGEEGEFSQRAGEQLAKLREAGVEQSKRE